MDSVDLVVEFELIRFDGSLTTTRYLALPAGLTAEEADDYMVEHIGPLAADYADWQYEVLPRAESARRAIERVNEVRRSKRGGQLMAANGAATDPGFAFALALREPGFRARVAMAGYTQGGTVVAIEPGTPWSFVESLVSDTHQEIFLARQTMEGGWEFLLYGPGQSAA